MADGIERYAEEIIPSDYTSWRYCIEVKCGLALTPEFVQERIVILSKPDHEETRPGCMAMLIVSRCWPGFAVPLPRYDSRV